MSKSAPPGFKRCLRLLLVLAFAAQATAEVAIEIDLSSQKAWVLREGQRLFETPISSGRAGHETWPGEYVVTEKDPEHRSSHYGRIVDRRGRTLIPDVDMDTPRPAGARFVQAPMRYFLRFDGAIGMHAGRLPGHPASHGCVRLPVGKAALFYKAAEIGTPVRVFGRAPRGR
jgi:lipoprotein-anchoring transpeptidase ErfK/SrfK